LTDAETDAGEGGPDLPGQPSPGGAVVHLDRDGRRSNGQRRGGCLHRGVEGGEEARQRGVVEQHGDA
jgi:hypothetical protein